LPFVSLPSSPLIPGVNPVEIYYRDEGQAHAPPLVLLHGGWGNTLYPFNRQIEKLRDEFRVICPDRSGYGRSTHLSEFNNLSTDFHYRAASETLALLGSLGIERSFLWGHSDGAVIAAIIGFTAPERVRGFVLEAFHYYRTKPASGEFFEKLAHEPEALGPELRERFAFEFGRDDWRRFITSHARAWLQIAAEGIEAQDDPGDDLYNGRLNELSAPVLFIHGRLDPRTEPGELDAIGRQLPNAEMRILDGTGHSPHSEPGSADLVTQIAREFLVKQYIEQSC
jgi:pimeloyl-ACP methyl ester carboxylesterase